MALGFSVPDFARLLAADASELVEHYASRAEKLADGWVHAVDPVSGITVGGHRQQRDIRSALHPEIRAAGRRSGAHHNKTRRLDTIRVPQKLRSEAPGRSDLLSVCVHRTTYIPWSQTGRRCRRERLGVKCVVTGQKTLDPLMAFGIR